MLELRLIQIYHFIRYTICFPILLLVNNLMGQLASIEKLIRE